AAGAHRAAASLFGLALRCASGLPPVEQAGLLEARAWECFLVADVAEAVDQRSKAVELWRSIGDPLRQGENLAELALALSGGLASGRGEARETSQAAIDLLAAHPPGRELALAYRIRALLHLYDHDLSEAIDLSERAIALAGQAQAARTQARAYDTLGLAW